MPETPEHVCSLRLSGEIDIAAVAGVLADATRYLETRPAVLEIDLGAVTFIDSSGLGALVPIRNQARDQGTTVTLVDVSSSARRVMELSGLDQVVRNG